MIPTDVVGVYRIGGAAACLVSIALLVAELVAPAAVPLGFPSKIVLLSLSAAVLFVAVALTWREQERTPEGRAQRFEQVIGIVQQIGSDSVGLEILELTAPFDEVDNWSIVNGKDRPNPKGLGRVEICGINVFARRR